MCSIKKGALKNFAIFTRKHLCQSPFFNKVEDAACNFIKKETLAQVFSCAFCEILKNIFFTEHLWKTVSTWNKIKCQSSKHQRSIQTKKTELVCQIVHAIQTNLYHILPILSPKWNQKQTRRHFRECRN